MTDLLYECFSGIAGDMHIGALLDLGVEEAWLREQLNRLPMAHEFELEVRTDKKMGIQGTRVRVKLAPDAARPTRHLRDIHELIDAARLPPRATARARAIFQEIAVAEAHVHGVAIEQVHFHEVGATDSIVDIVAAGLCLEALNIERVYCGPIELGGGMVKCAHGVFPVPVPATAEILKGIPCQYGRVPFETTTPTGAAILKATVDAFRIPDGFVVERIGYGIGHKDFDVPNVVRASLGHTSSTTHRDHYEREDNIEIQCNIDDMTPEAFGPLQSALFAAGALDVSTAPAAMKKQRPATLLSVLVRPAQADDVIDALFTHSTTLGVRTHEVQKVMLPRELRQVRTTLGEVQVKVAHHADGSRRFKVEYDDVAQLALSLGRNFLSVQEQITREVAAQIEPAGGSEA